jgi:hypothetical protein
MKERHQLKFKAFTSYSHAADGKLASALQFPLHRFTNTVGAIVYYALFLFAAMMLLTLFASPGEKSEQNALILRGAALADLQGSVYRIYRP